MNPNDKTSFMTVTDWMCRLVLCCNVSGIQPKNKTAQSERSVESGRASERKMIQAPDLKLSGMNAPES